MKEKGKKLINLVSGMIVSVCLYLTLQKEMHEQLQTILSCTPMHVQ